MFARWLVPILIFCAIGASATESGAPALRLTGSVPAAEVFAGHVEFLRDPGRNLGIEDVRAADFSPVAGASAGFGYTEDAIWLRIGVVNAMASGTDQIGKSDWRMHFRSNFLPEFAVWLIDGEGNRTELENQRQGSVFGSRAVPYPELVAPFRLAPGESGTLYVRYRSGGTSELSFGILTADGFAALAARQTARNFVFYGMMLLLSGAALLAAVLTRRAIFAAYGCYACVAMLFVMHADGNAFQYLWPNLPAFNGHASVLLGAGLIVFGANFARMFLRTRTFHPVLNLLLIGLMVLTLSMVAVSFVGGTQTIKKLLVFLAFLSTLLFTVSGLVAARKRFREVRFYVLAWVGAVAASAIMTGRHWLGLEISEQFQFNAMRVVMVTDAMMMGLAILDSVNQMRQAQRSALETALIEAQENLELNHRLSELEARYATVLATAEKQERRLADTVHDLRQPLAALRLNVQRLQRRSTAIGAGKGAAPRREDFEESFDYLERLVTEELARQGNPVDGSTGGRIVAAALPAPDRGHQSVDQVLSSVAEMFAPSAAAVGKEIRYVRTGARTALPSLVLMRIANNLLSNAVKYSHGARVVIGVRWRNGVAWLEVHDGGPGLSEQAFDRARARSARLDTESGAEGSGLGLAIVDKLAGAHGLSVVLCPGRVGGTGIAVSLPAA